MLKSSVQRFGEDLKKISEIIRTKSMCVLVNTSQHLESIELFSSEFVSLFHSTQIRTALKQRMYDQTQTSPRKAQKRTASQSAGQTEETTVKKAKGQGDVWKQTQAALESKKL